MRVEKWGGIILAGGNSTRFGGVDKALVDTGGGRTLLEMVVGRLKFLDEIIISASSEIKASMYGKATGMETTIDTYPGMLGGILAGCEALSSPRIFVTGVDMPFLRRDVITRQFLQMGDYQAVVPRHPNGFIEPLHMVIDRKPAVMVLRELSETSERRVARLFDALRTYYLPTENLLDLDPQLGCFTNINDRETFRKVFHRS